MDFEKNLSAFCLPKVQPIHLKGVNSFLGMEETEERRVLFRQIGTRVFRENCKKAGSLKHFPLAIKALMAGKWNTQKLIENPFFHRRNKQIDVSHIYMVPVGSQQEYILG